jgi:hypothetical protein
LPSMLLRPAGMLALLFASSASRLMSRSAIRSHRIYVGVRDDEARDPLGVGLHGVHPVIVVIYAVDQVTSWID